MINYARLPIQVLHMWPVRMAGLLISDDNEHHTETCCKSSSRVLKRHVARQSGGPRENSSLTVAQIQWQRTSQMS